MTDEQLATELKKLGKQWDDLRAALEECGGSSGSPGEWLWERIGELEHEQQKRVALAQQPTTEIGT